jgi:hypothetical protein
MQIHYVLAFHHFIDGKMIGDSQYSNEFSPEQNDARQSIYQTVQQL